MGQCSFDGCDRSATAKGFCQLHYVRWLRHGDPATVLRGPDVRVPGKRRCASCGETKPVEDFGKGNKSCKDGLSVYCRPCNAKRQQEWRKANPERMRELQRQSYHRRKSGRAERRIKEMYGITVEQFDQLLADQGGCCAVCGTSTPNGPGKRFHIDHDHACCARVGSCGKCIRGLLCSRCNTALGLLGDDPGVYSRAAAYIGRPLRTFTM